MKGKLLFEEKQMFRGTPLWYLVTVVSALTIIGVFISVLYANEPIGYIVAAATSFIMLIVVLILSAAKLEVTLDSSNIYYRYPPFINGEKILRKEDLEEVYVRKYSPIAEYGGYGFRFSFRSGKAFNIRGNMGLQLVFKGGKKLLIGTQKPDEMKAAVAKLKENWNMHG